MTTEIATNVDPNTKQQQQQLQKQNSNQPDAIIEQQIVSAQPNIKYPLENTWSFWFFKNEKSKEWKDNLVFITNVEFVEDFWAVYNHLQPVSKLNAGCDYMLFKKDIQPMWEDPQNRDGGRWILNLDKKNKQTPIDAYWLNTLLGLIGDQFYDESAYVNGAVINLRPKLDKICLWTRCARDQEVQNRIGNRLKELLNLKENLMVFEPHQKD